MGVSPDEFYNLSMHEFYSILAAKYPEQYKKKGFETDESFFDQEEKERLEEMKIRLLNKNKESGSGKHR